MEFAEVVRRRRMVRTYDSRPVPAEVVDAIVDAGRRAPSAGYTQGTSFLVLEGPGETSVFWEATAASTGDPAPGGRWERLRAAPVIVLPVADRDAYLRRYGEADKAGLGMSSAEGWPAPYWMIDAAFAAMAMLLAATDAGVGALFFAIGHGEAELRRALGIPDDRDLIGAITLGWPAPVDVPSPSLARGRRPAEEIVHHGRWGRPSR